ncbi:hypothetical protein P0Y43_07610 [Pseudomonas entomophila]|uniref:hypothetical protein n=1 Tax=Pseudomonas entomophila TaxID=312306 RepID=UPI0023D8793A|nr:hypothetical protein [Pseudomonas entomophila]MDF0730599.1 hypothetical protein [Pseudomonas entomophila]
MTQPALKTARPSSEQNPAFAVLCRPFQSKCEKIINGDRFCARLLHSFYAKSARHLQCRVDGMDNNSDRFTREYHTGTFSLRAGDGRGNNAEVHAAKKGTWFATWI